MYLVLKREFSRIILNEVKLTQITAWKDINYYSETGGIIKLTYKKIQIHKR